MKALFLKSIAIVIVLSLMMAFTKSNYSKERWIHDATVDNVEFYHQVVKCENWKKVGLRMINKNSQAVTVSWTEVFTVEPEQEGLKGKKEKTEKSERITKGKQFVVEPGEVSETSCATAKHFELFTAPIQFSPADEVEVVAFKFRDIKVTRQQ